MKRFAFLDWMRGAAVLIMIQSHVFQSFTLAGARHGRAYILSQWVGGMAAPLFLFMAGMTFGFQMESADRREPTRWSRIRAALRRAGYLFLIAYLFRLTNLLGGLPRPHWVDFLKVDILNCMALAMAAASLLGALEFTARIRAAVLGAILVAAAAPIVSGLDWSGVPSVIAYYFVPGADRAQFPFFPCASYLGFGVAAGSLVKRTGQERLAPLMQWGVLGGGVLIFTAEYFSNLPYSVYSHSEFWRNSPGLIFIRVGITLLLLAASYAWTAFIPKPLWTWIENLGKTSLLVYWVHVMLVYGSLARPLKRSLPPAGSAAATLVTILLMIALSEFRLRHKLPALKHHVALPGAVRPAPVEVQTTVAGGNVVVLRESE